MQTSTEHLNPQGVVDDLEYWENYYAQRKMPFSPSLFARKTLRTSLKRNDTLIELGCGNGRDAVYFAHHGIRVTAIDQCINELTFLANTYPLENLKFQAGDFTRLPHDFRYHHVYSRFTLHAISNRSQSLLIQWIAESLEPGGLFHLEARGKQNELYSKGDPVPGEPGAYIFENHFRRFIELNEISDELKQAGLDIIEAIEAPGFSPFNGKDEIFIRLVARKPLTRSSERSPS